MNTRSPFMILILTALMTTGSAFAGINLDPGQWELTTETEMQGMPGMNIPSSTQVQCITQNDLVPMNQDTSQDCRMTDVSVKGESVSWKIVCDGKSGRMEGTGQATYHGDSMKGTMEMIMKDNNMKIMNRITGRRIGDCNGQAAASSIQTAPQTKEEPSEVEKALSEDAKDVGQAARGEAKDATTDEVRRGGRGLFDKIFN